MKGNFTIEARLKAGTTRFVDYVGVNQDTHASVRLIKSASPKSLKMCCPLNCVWMKKRFRPESRILPPNRRRATFRTSRVPFAGFYVLILESATHSFIMFFPAISCRRGCSWIETWLLLCVCEGKRVLLQSERPKARTSGVAQTRRHYGTKQRFRRSVTRKVYSRPRDRSRCRNRNRALADRLDADEVMGQGRRRDGGDFGLVVGRCDLHHVHSDKLDVLQGPEDL